MKSHIFLLGLLAGCTTAGTNQNATETATTSLTPATSELDLFEQEDRRSGVLRVERENPGNLKIMRDSCRGRYKVLADRDAKYPQIELGVSRSIGGPGDDSHPAAPYPYIRYRCED